MMFHVTLEHGEDGWVTAECPALPGCISQGMTEEEAIRNVKEAMTAWMYAEDAKAAKGISATMSQVMVAL